MDEAKERLSEPDATKACGPDKIPVRQLKECTEQISPSLCSLFIHSLNKGKIPRKWKSADVTPIHKKDSKEAAENYRPISLLPIVSKVLELCVGNRFYTYVKDLASALQDGFLPNRSCVTQLLSVLHTIGQSLDKNIQTDMIYLDFAKAFDTVDHSVLLEKLRLYGVKGHLFCWFKDYLTERTQRVVSSTEYCNLIQDTLSNMHHWSQRNNIRFNTSKCKALTVTRKKTPIGFDYTLDGTTLTRVSEEKDLGVIITSTISWDSHLHTVTAKANKLLGLLKRTCPLLTDVSLRRSLYLSLVKSQLCYATQVWSPAYVTLNAKVEQVQRRASR